MWRAALLVAVMGCVSSASHVCADGRTCPPDQVCDDQHALCVFPDQLTSCGGDGSNGACSLSEPPGAGECVDSVCIIQTCGDHLVTGAESCDGADTQPETGTCVDLEFDYGALACSQICGDDPQDCGRLGWQFVGVPGMGPINGFAEDGGVMWAAGGNGVYRRDGDVWSSLGYVTASHVTARAIWAGGGQVFVAGTVLPVGMGYVLHFDGTTWDEKIISSAQLYGVWGRSPTEVYASGETGIYKFDGTAWTLFASPPVLDAFRAISGSSSLVVATTTSGGTWELTASGPRTIHITGTGALNAVYVTGTKVFVGGESGFTALGENGIYNPLAQALPTRVLAMSGRSETEVYAALDVNSRSNLFILEGKAWAAMASPLEDQPVNAIYAGAHDVIAARRPGTVMVYQGAGWVDEPPLSPSPAAGLWATPDYAVSGSSLAGCHVLERGTATSTWSLVPFSDDPCCTDKFALTAWGLARSNVYVGGAYGMMLHKIDESTWTCQVITNRKWIAGVWGASATDVWAVGADRDGTLPNLLHSADGTTWVDRTSDVGFAGALRGVWGSASNDVFAVGSGGVIAHFDGTAWTRMQSGTTDGLNAIWGSAAGDVFAIGDNGTIVHYDGTAWTRMPLPIGRTLATNAAYVAIHGTSGHDVYAVGQRVLLHYDGVHWAPIRRPDELELGAVFAQGSSVQFVTENGVGSELIGFGR